jgi:hypothetical protein
VPPRPLAPGPRPVPRCQPGVESTGSDQAPPAIGFRWIRVALMASTFVILIFIAHLPPDVVSSAQQAALTRAAERSPTSDH